MLLLDHTATISRTQTVGTNGRSQMATLYSGISCLLLPMSAQAAVQQGYTVGQAYHLYFDQSQDIKTGDKVTIDGRNFLIRGVEPFVGLAAQINHSCCAATPESANG